MRASRPNHRSACKEKRNANQGKPFVGTNPVLKVVRKVNQNEKLLSWIDYVLIACLGLTEDIQVAKTHSVYLPCQLVPVPDSSAKGGVRPMVLTVLWAEKSEGVEHHCALIEQNERRMEIRKGTPKAYVDATAWANSFGSHGHHHLARPSTTFVEESHPRSWRRSEHSAPQHDQCRCRLDTLSTLPLHSLGRFP